MRLRAGRPSSPSVRGSRGRATGQPRWLRYDFELIDCRECHLRDGVPLTCVLPVQPGLDGVDHRRKGGTGEPGRCRGRMVLPERIELSTSPLPRECSTTELRQRPGAARFLPAPPGPRNPFRRPPAPSREEADAWCWRRLSMLLICSYTWASCPDGRGVPGSSAPGHAGFRVKAGWRDTRHQSHANLTSLGTCSGDSHPNIICSSLAKRHLDP